MMVSYIEHLYANNLYKKNPSATCKVLPIISYLHCNNMRLRECVKLKNSAYELKVIHKQIFVVRLQKLKICQNVN